MKSTPAVFLTSLAVSAFSLTIPLPAATTVLNLFIGEDLTVQETARTKGEACQHTTHEADDADAAPACTSPSHHRHDNATQTGGDSFTHHTVYIKRLRPNAAQDQPVRVSSAPQRPERKHKAYSRLTCRLYINEQAQAYSLEAGQWLRIPKLLASSGNGMVQRLSEQYRNAGARETAFILHTRSVKPEARIGNLHL